MGVGCTAECRTVANNIYVCLSVIGFPPDFAAKRRPTARTRGSVNKQAAVGGSASYLADTEDGVRRRGSQLSTGMRTERR